MDLGVRPPGFKSQLSHSQWSDWPKYCPLCLSVPTVKWGAGGGSPMGGGGEDELEWSRQSSAQCPGRWLSPWAGEACPRGLGQAWLTGALTSCLESPSDQEPAAKGWTAGGVPSVRADSNPQGILELFPRHLMSDEENLLDRLNFPVFLCPPDFQAWLCAGPRVTAWVEGLKV